MKTMEGLVLCSANYIPLSPISFLERAAYVYQNRVSIIYGDVKYSWKETHERCIKLASAISDLGITRGDIVAAIAPNIPELYELHFGVPMAGAVLTAFNPKLTATAIALKLEQLEAKIIFVDYQSINVVKEAFEILSLASSTKPSIIVLIQEMIDSESSSSHNSRELFMEKVLDYDEILAIGQLDFKIIQPKDECDPISINFTSGSTGEPKGVVYSHRAAYLKSISLIFCAEMRDMPVFLWTVDMFRCNGWCFPWTVAALGGTNICLRDVTGKAILDAIFDHNVTHFCGSPGILTKIVDAIADDQQKLSHNVNVLAAGAMPPTEVRIKLESLGFRINSGYGMTEALGVVTTSPWTSIDDQSQTDEDETISIREGIHNFMMEKVDVIDPKTMTSVLPDGKSIGEIRFRSNTMMSGYFKNLKATQEAFEGGWYGTRDLGIKHPNGFIEFKDRANDIITCGGEYISTLDIEAVLIRHPMVLEAAVVGRPDDRLGETPCAFVKLIEKSSLNAEEIMEFCSSHLPSYMIPQTVVFQDLLVNSTGKVQKFALRDKAKAMENE